MTVSNAPSDNSAKDDLTATHDDQGRPALVNFKGHHNQPGFAFQNMYYQAKQSHPLDLNLCSS